MEVQKKNLEQEIKRRRKKQWESSRKESIFQISSTPLDYSKKHPTKEENLTKRLAIMMRDEKRLSDVVWIGNSLAFSKEIFHIYHRNYIYHRNIFLQKLCTYGSVVGYDTTYEILCSDHICFSTLYRFNKCQFC